MSPPDPPRKADPGALVVRRPRVRWVKPVSLVSASILLLLADLGLAITRTASASLLLTALETLLLPVWVMVVVDLESQDTVLGGGKLAARKPRWLTLAMVLAVLVACVAEKWVLLGHPAGALDTKVVALYRAYTVLAFVLANGSLLGRRPLERLLVSTADHPARLMAISFGVAALIGAFLLTLPQAVHDIRATSFVDGLFMATSAVCVTGLAVHNVADVYTPFGQAIIFVLFQVGGLGIMVLSTFFAILAGRKIRLRDAAVMAEMIDAESFTRLRRSVASIVTYTLVVEALGAAALYLCFRPIEAIGHASTPGEGFSGAGGQLWAAVFHSVSAFCNAGFSLFRDGLVPAVSSASIGLVIMGLIIVGGVGFPVHDELLRLARARVRGERPPRLSLHSRTVLWTTLVLVAFGAAAFLLLEWNRSMRGLPLSTRLLASLFQSVTTRTAGFNTLDFGAMGHATWLLTSVFMFIGAAPGSTGGGVKVTTIAVLFATLRAELRGFEAPRLLGRTVPSSVVRRAMGLAFLSVLLVAGFLFLLLLVEPHNPLAVAFETVSAFATVGLSTGITPSLSTPGRLAITLVMFIGRIGPLTLALALANPSGGRSFRLPEERVGIG